MFIIIPKFKRQKSNFFFKVFRKTKKDVYNMLFIIMLFPNIYNFLRKFFNFYSMRNLFLNVYTSCSHVLFNKWHLLYVLYSLVKCVKPRTKYHYLFSILYLILLLFVLYKLLLSYFKNVFTLILINYLIIRYKYISSTCSMYMISLRFLMSYKNSFNIM